MIILISVVIFYQVTQSKAEFNRLKKHISTAEALHFLIANPHLTSRHEEIIKIKRDSIPIVLKMDSPKLRKKSRREKERENEDQKNPKASGTAEPITSHDVEEDERGKDHKDIFYIHDEVVAKNDSMTNMSEPFRRTKSERLIRNKQPFIDPPRFRLHRSNSGGLINLCFVNDSVIETSPQQQKQQQQELMNVSKDLTSDGACSDDDITNNSKILTSNENTVLTNDLKNLTSDKDKPLTTVPTNLTDNEDSPKPDKASSTINLTINNDENNIEEYDKTDNVSERSRSSDDINDTQQSKVLRQPDNRSLLEKFGDERIVEVTHF